MLPKTHLSQLVPNRTKRALERMEPLIWRNRQPLAVKATEAGPEHISFEEAKKRSLHAVEAKSAWGHLYDQRWCRVELPSGTTGNPFLEWRDQGEATLYHQGSPYAGFDVAHRYVKVPSGVSELWVESYCVQSAIWHPQATGLSPEGSQFQGAWLVERDEEAWAAWLDLKVLFDLLFHLRSKEHPSLPQQLGHFGLLPAPSALAPRHRQLLHWLDKAIDAWETTSIAAMREVLAEAYEDLRDEKAALTSVLTGHAHIDLVWLWPEHIGEAKAVHTFSTLCRLLDQFPEMRFAYSQTASYEAVGRKAPALLKEVKGKIKSGTWEATGALYVESDTQIACGEALARSFVLGQEGFTDLSGKPSKMVWLPDVFGYSGCLPQLMQLSGVDFFFTTKLTWSAINHFPYSSFVWRGTDGSEVVAHVTQGVGYNGIVSFDELHRNAEMHAQADVHREYLHPVGYGDGGGGPTEEMAERARRVSKLAGTPSVTWGQPEAFMERLKEIEAQLPVWKGECYLEYHRGTYTSESAVKSVFRGLERALQVREAIAAATGTLPDLTHPWKRLVFAQFHDYIPGSSVPEVYAEGVPELARLAEEQSKSSQVALGGAGKDAIFNPHATTWQGWVEGPNGPVFVSLPALSGQAFKDVTAPAPAQPSAEGQTLRNDRVCLTLSKDGSIASLTIDGEPLRLKSGAGLPVLYPDRPANFDAWDIDRASLSLGQAVHEVKAIRAGKAEAHRATLSVEFKVGEKSHLTLHYILEAGATCVRLELDLDWQESDHLLRLEFPTDYRGSMARFGAPFGSTLRSQTPGPNSHEAQWEVPGSRWAAVSHDGESDGLWLATEAKYGFNAREGRLGLSLVRSPLRVGYEGHAAASPRSICRTPSDSPHSDIGRQTIQLALGRYAPASDLPHPALLADQLFTAPLPYAGPAVQSPLPGIEHGPTLIPAWVKPCQGGCILRYHEVAGTPGKLSLQLNSGWIATPVDLLEKPLGDSGSHFTYGPYQILSVKLTQAG